MRKVVGLGLRAFKKRFGIRFEELFAGQIEDLRREGLIELRGGFAALTPRGMELQNRVLVKFL